MTSIVVFGAGGRAGRAVTAEARRRGVAVTAVVRDPARHPDLPAVTGDVTDAAGVAAIVRGHDSAVNAVSPASGPEELATLDLDPDFFATAAGALLDSGVPRVVAIGLVSNLDGADPLPEQFRAFADAHAAGLRRLREADRGWVMLTPPALLSAELPRLGGYRLGGETISEGRLSYADLAIAVLDEIERPTVDGARVTVVSAG
ncbi:flavin reductase [Actinoplanes sp. SE50]|uniref:NAD(P)-dependent oxidoreductase n=1 Tax=unclassified Actinoplanes TaxID=2626549 RepID=UPI00023ECCFA|nr:MULTISPECIES: NAD(P)H-binding protein [unclassified Actinoplanes]AEV85461.1 Flavin reductase [Actinoplanes sp. SE50/110]ATO83854.1 flavin reductase [Actinoplanes sp. SE50]SLM01264.1 flavin reductase [Actinoplanes sp. SE50/110]